MKLKRHPDVVLRFGPAINFIQARPILLRVVASTRNAIVADLPSERLEGRDSPHDPLIMAQPSPDDPDPLMSVIDRAVIQPSCPVLDVDDVLVRALAKRTRGLIAKPGDFMRLFLANAVDADVVDDYVGMWHALPSTPQPCPLAQWLGMADWEYTAFVLNHNALHDIKAKRLAGNYGASVPAGNKD